ncbi:MAG: helix-turn-helix transcriptional regulator [Lachnospiraceae bacterium]|nr:helix-turn-helix transcriptional regulator [Lachnospiraceae bacterium]
MKKSVRKYIYKDETGDAQVTVYQLFPGIEVAYIAAHMAEFDFGVSQKGSCKRNAIIHYCREGRLEQEGEKEFFYLMPGDCSINIRNKRKTKFRLPVRHYHGVCIGIDLDEVNCPILAFCENCGYAPNEIMEHICGELFHTILRSSESVRKYFDGLYEVSHEQRLDYLRMKLPELFYKMKYLHTDTLEVRNPVPRTQVDFVKQVAHYISENINEKITVKRLTQEFGVSDSYLQNAFRNVYGMPVISFIRVQKMQCAAQVLIQTTQTIDEIAETFGYENESKFSAAFKRIMGDSPGVFRKEHSKIKII